VDAAMQKGVVDPDPSDSQFVHARISFRKSPG